MDIQPRDCDPFDLARRAANVSELISASPAECTAHWDQVVGRGTGAHPVNMSFKYFLWKKQITEV